MATKSITYLKPCLIREPSPRTDKVLLYMELTGKAEIDFKKWYYKWRSMANQKNITELTPLQFYNLPESMKYGVYVDFSNTTDSRISLISNDSYYDYWFYKIIIPHENGMDIIVHKGSPKPLHEAMKEGVEKFSEIYNEIN